MRKCLAILLLTLSASAQVRESVTVNVVEVPVTVVDRDGNPIRSLTAANFELLDEGKQRAISSFESIDFTSRESLRAASALNPAARRHFMLVFDLAFSQPRSLLKAQEAARDFINTLVQPRDRVAIASVDAEHGFRLLTAFTTDRNALLGAIGDPRNFTATDPLQIAGNPINPESKNVSGSEIPGGRQNGGGGGSAEEQIHDINKQLTKHDDAYVRARINRVITTLGGLAKLLDAVHGRKEVVLLSEGFDPKYVQGRDVRPSRELTEENEAASHGEIWNVDSDRRFGSADSMSVIDRMAQLFKRSDVVMHAIDIQGVRVQNDLREGSRVNSNDGLFLVAKPTGGEVFRDTNDLKSSFEKMLRQQEMVYVLGFNAPAQKAGTFHTLKVRLVNVPGARITHRPGYYESGGDSPVERSLTNAQIILNDVAQADVRVALLAAPFPTGQKNAQVPVILEIDGDDLLKSANGTSATAEVFVYAFDDEGLVRDSMFQRMALDLTKVGDKLKGSGLKWYGTLSLPEGKYAVKSLVRIAETEKKGYARTDVTVPRAGDTVVLQPFFYDDAPARWLMVKGASHAPANAPYPFEVNAEVFVPMAAPHGGKFAVFVYNVAPDEMTLETTPAAKVLSQVRGAGGVVKTVMELKNAAGAKSVEVVVKKKGSGDVRTARTDLLP